MRDKVKGTHPGPDYIRGRIACAAGNKHHGMIFSSGDVMGKTE
jgi:hypothetical protein